MTFIDSSKETALKDRRAMLGQRYNTAYVVIPMVHNNCSSRLNRLKQEFGSNEIQRVLFSNQGIIEDAFLIPLDVTDIVTLMVFAWDNHQEEVIVISETCAFLKYKRQCKLLNVATEQYKHLGELKTTKSTPLSEVTWVKDSKGNYFVFDKE